MGLPHLLRKALSNLAGWYMKVVTSYAALRVILMTFALLFAGVCLAGIFFIDTSDDEVSAVEELWLPRDSPIASNNAQFMEDWGMQNLDRVLLLPKNGASDFIEDAEKYNKTALLAGLNFFKKIQQLNGTDPETGETFTYTDLCYQPSSLINKCLYYSLYDYWNYDEEVMMNDETIGYTLASPNTTGQLGSLMVDRCSVTGGLEFRTVNDQTMLTYLASQGMWIFMEKTGLSPSAARAMKDWENNFMTMSQEMNDDKESPINVYSVTGTSLEDEIEETVEGDMLFIIICIITLLLSCPVALLITAGPNHDWWLTGTIGWTLFLTVGMAMGVSEWARALDLKITYSGEALMVFGLIVYCSFFRVGLQWILRSTPKSATTSHMLAYTRDIGSLFLPPLTICSLSLTLALSVLCIFCPIPAIVCYLSLFFIGIMADYIMLVCFVLPFLACRFTNNYNSDNSDEDDIVIYTNSSCCCSPSSTSLPSPPSSPSPPSPPHLDSSEEYSLLVINTPESDAAQETYLKKLSEQITKITPLSVLVVSVVFMFVLVALISVFCFLFTPPQFYTYEYLPKDNYVGIYYQYEAEYGYDNNALPVSCVIGEDIDINNPFNGPLLFELSDACNSSKWVNSSQYRSFYVSFTQFCDSKPACRRTMQEGYPTGSSFRSFFLIFVGDSPDNQIMLGDVKLSPTGTVSKGQFGSFSTYGCIREYVDQKEFPYSMMSDINKVNAGESYAQSEVFPYFGGYEPSARYSFYFLLFLSVFLLFLSFLFLSPQIALVCVCGVAGCEAVFIFGVIGGLFQLDLGVLTIPAVLCSLPNVFAFVFCCCYEFNLSVSADGTEGVSLSPSSFSAFFSSSSVVLPLSCISQLFYLFCKSPVNFYSFALFEFLYVLLLMTTLLCVTLMVGLWRSERAPEDDDENRKTDLNSLS